jgi:hypothetical protein
MGLPVRICQIESNFAGFACMRSAAEKGSWDDVQLFGTDIAECDDQVPGFIRACRGVVMRDRHPQSVDCDGLVLRSSLYLDNNESKKNSEEQRLGLRHKLSPESIVLPLLNFSGW